MAGFQSSINRYLAPGVEGDFAGHGIRASMLAGEGAFVAGPEGVIVGRFAWIDGNDVYNKGTVPPVGFIHREQQALITAYMGEASMLIQPYTQVTIMTQGDFFAKTATATTIGQKVFASTADGSIATGAAGATVAGYVETEFYVGSAVAAGELVKISTWIYGVNGTGE